MPFDPALPATGSPVSSAQMRSQLTGLKSLIDAVPATSYGRVASDWTSGSSAFTDVPGLAFAVGAGETWSAEVVLATVSGTSGQGLKFRASGPGASGVLITIQGTGTSGSTAMECEVQTAFSVATPTKTFCSGTSLSGVVRLHIVANNTTAGTVQLQASNSSGSGTVTIKANSDVLARRVG